ncbi:LD-carboxypeptidase, partial [Bacillus thuringiensis]|nr:LD-carboxypeptidase [Bacillus thuringiensis]
VLQNQKIPFLADFDCCHTHPMITIPFGVQVELDATNKTIHIVESWKK